jgi:Domain of Unknown Function (DUF1080)
VVSVLAFAVWFTQPPAFASAGVTVFSGAFEAQPLALSWADGSRHGVWQSVYNGYGRNGVTVDGSQVLTLRPAVSVSPDDTHGGLVTTVRSFGNVDATVRVRTVDQLRVGPPNPWEVGWVLWNYTDDVHFYYLVLKPNGWELGKEDPAYPGAQRYLATSGSSHYAVGSWHTFRVRQVGATISVWGDGTFLKTFTDRQRPYFSGHLGLYTEDAAVHFDTINVRLP